MNILPSITENMKQGAVIAHCHDGCVNIVQYHEDGYADHLDVFVRESVIVTVMVVDSFGQKFNAKMDLGVDDQLEC